MGEALHSRQTSPVSTGFDRKLYSLLPNPPGITNPDELERKLAALEGRFADIRDKLLEGKKPSQLSDAERENWTTFLLALEHRGPRVLRKEEEVALKAAEDLAKEAIAKSPHPEHLEQLVLGKGGLAHHVSHNAVRSMLGKRCHDVDSRRRLNELTWCIWSCDEGPRLITSDYPLVYPGEEQSAALLLPLSPTFLFCAFREVPRPQELALLGVTSNLLHIVAQPNYIYSMQRLEDVEPFNLHTMAKNCLQPTNPKSPA